MDDYRAHPAIAQSDLKTYAKSKMAFYLEKVRGIRPPEKKSRSLDFGNRFDRWVLEPEALVTVPDHVLSKPNAATGVRAKTGKAYKDFCRQFIDDDQIGITETEELELLRAQAFAAEFHPRIHRILWELEKQTKINLFWPCPETGIERKCEIDCFVPEPRLIVDVKTGRDTSWEHVERDIYEYGYHIQAATYLEAMTFSDDYPDPAGYVIIIFRNEWPYDCEIYDLHRCVPEGEDFNRREMRRLAADLERNDWGPITRDETFLVSRPSGYVGRKWDGDDGDLREDGSSDGTVHGSEGRCDEAGPDGEPVSSSDVLSDDSGVGASR